ncbi:uncharacterized protein PGTG_00137 [Puccinia graminis f. sp. tritici CRL 75-36-700-3]|uniref:Uncharacterized protein n=1 Tax=Puccinia graminis f. sp. tritici (strain CRL 75-36-700-3 / race SCCL) TaxID=418459 RepID=E3JR41_PUCGT|nr:uncharacterized protein PGTG_00137 [Puccinia graminis f. sp. tritici CRL 75-36-700-3]EFP74181.2 hypothetical protein PGTG_00137 [Puccinia graminis f. sp. tritici CRL 75-36-700-3]
MMLKSQRTNQFYHQLGRLSSTTTKPPRPAGGGRTRPGSPIKESPRVPVRLPSPSRLKSVSLSPLIDEKSPLSLPESDYNRLKWLNRFTPRWDESKNERLARFKLRAQKMRTRRAHTEKLFNSFQRLDGFTSTILPSAFRNGRLPDKILPNPGTTNHNNNRAGQQGRVRKDEKMGRDILKHRKKLRALYRFTQEPKVSPHLADQVASQLARRIAQECVVWRATLSRPAPGTISSLDDLVAKTGPGRIARISDHPTLSSGPALLSYLESLLKSQLSKSPQLDDPVNPAGQRVPDPSASLGAILVKSSGLFRQLGRLQPSQGTSSEQLSPDDVPASSQDHPHDTLLFSLHLPDGPVPVWDLEGLLARMAKPPPRQASGVPLVTAALEGSASVSSETSLAEVLAGQIDEALRGPGHLARADSEAYVVPLTEGTYPLILALRRATWWLGQGFESDHFAQIGAMVHEAEARKSEREAQWLAWVRGRNTVEGKIKRNGQLWIPFSTRSATPRKLWRRV